LECYCIYYDNFFSGPSLFQKLKIKDKGAISTMWADKKYLPTDTGLQTCNRKWHEPTLWMNVMKCMTIYTWEDTG
jgi:hypothetical protein